MKNNYLIQAWLVLTLALGFGAALSCVQTVLGPRIKQNKKNETLKRIPELVPGAKTGKALEKPVAGYTVYKAVDEAGGHVGWVVKAAGAGFADKIEVLIGLDATAETITGLYVLDQKETPELGNKIVEETWRSQFAGKSAAVPLAVTKAAPAGNEIRTVTAATISSESVCNIVNAAVAEVKDELARLAGLESAEKNG